MTSERQSGPDRLYRKHDHKLSVHISFRDLVSDWELTICSFLACFVKQIIEDVAVVDGANWIESACSCNLVRQGTYPIGPLARPLACDGTSAACHY